MIDVSNGHLKGQVQYIKGPKIPTNQAHNNNNFKVSEGALLYLFCIYAVCVLIHFPSNSFKNYFCLHDLCKFFQNRKHYFVCKHNMSGTTYRRKYIIEILGIHQDFCTFYFACSTPVSFELIPL